MSVLSRLLLLCLVIAGVTAADPATGQIIYGQQAQGSISAVSTHWKLILDEDETTIDQWAFPAMAFVPLADNFEARVYAAYSMTTVKQLGQEFELRGPSDLRIQANHAFADDRLLLGAGVNLPVGQTGLSLDEEWVVMNYLSQSFLSFPVRSLGSGFGLNLMAGGATELGEYRLGATATLDLAGAYEAYRTEEDYQPGTALSLTLGVQRELDSMLLNGDATLTTSGDDKQGDNPVLSRGDQLALHAGMQAGDELKGYFVDATYRIRGRNTVYDPDGVLLQQLKIYGNEFALGGGFEWTSNSGWTYGPTANLRLIQGNEYGLGNSKVLGLGAQVAREVVQDVNLRLALKYFTGSTHDGEIDLGGFQIWLGASGTF